MGYSVIMPLWLAVTLWLAIALLLLLWLHSLARSHQRRKTMRRQIEGLQAYVDSMKWLNER